MTSTNPDKYTENFWLSFAEITFAGITKGREWCATVSFFEEFKQRLYDLKNSGSSLPSDSNSRRKHPHAAQSRFTSAGMDADEQLSYISSDSINHGDISINNDNYYAANNVVTDEDDDDTYIVENTQYDGMNTQYSGIPCDYRQQHAKTSFNSKQSRSLKRRESEAGINAFNRGFGRNKRSSSYCTGEPEIDIAQKSGFRYDNSNAHQHQHQYHQQAQSSLKTSHIIMAPISNYSNIKESSSSNFTVYTIQTPITTTSTTDSHYLLTPMQQPQSQYQKQMDDRSSDPLYCFIRRVFPDAKEDFIDKQLQVLLSEGVFGLSSLCVSVKNQSQWAELEKKLNPKLCDAIIKNFGDTQQTGMAASGASPSTLPATPSTFELVEGSAVSSPSIDFSAAASGTFSKYNENTSNCGEESLQSCHRQHNPQKHHSKRPEKRNYNNDNNNESNQIPKISELFAVNKNDVANDNNDNNNSFGNRGFNNALTDDSINEGSINSSKKSYDDDDTKSICLDETF